MSWQEALKSVVMELFFNNIGEFSSTIYLLSNGLELIKSVVRVEMLRQSGKNMMLLRLSIGSFQHEIYAYALIWGLS